jgi:hypothetical protein
MLSEELKLYAVTKDGLTIRYFKDPSEELKIV